MSKSTKPFAVRSITKSWHLYKAFAEELKILGYEVATHFNDFNYEMFKTRDCIYISNKWNSRPYPPSFTFSCTNGEVIVLETDWEKAIQAAKDFILNTGTFKLTKDYTAEIDYSGEVIRVGCQTIPFKTVNELYKKINNL
jgi:hypothetical protein